MSEQTPSADQDDAAPAHEERPDGVPPGAAQVRLRTAPRFARFTGTGALLGLLAGLALVLTRPVPALEVSLTAAAGYLAVIGGLVGAVTGAGLAVLADRRSRHRG